MSNQPTLFTYMCDLKYVTDGDTVRLSWVDLGFSMKLHNVAVRIAEIDTPESRINLKRYPERTAEKELGLKAKARLKELLVGDVRLQSLERDKYGRVLGHLFVDGINVSDILIREGLACPYYGATKQGRVREDGTWGV